MISLLIMVIVFLAIARVLSKRGLTAGRLRSPIEPGPAKPTLPAAAPEPQPALRDGKATVDTLMDDFAEGRISVEEYERRLDKLYKKGHL